MAVKFARVAVETAVVAMLKFALTDPSGTVKVAGGVATALSEDKVTVNPPGGASPVNVMVPVPLFPPTTDPGLIVNLENTAGLSVRVVDAEIVCSKAETVAVSVAATEYVVILKVAVVVRGGKVIVASGTTS